MKFLIGCANLYALDKLYLKVVTVADEEEALMEAIRLELGDAIDLEVIRNKDAIKQFAKDMELLIDATQYTD